MYLCAACFVLFLSTFSVESANILVVYPFPAKSLGILGQGYVRLLLKAGHHVTFVTNYPFEYDDKKLRIIDTSGDLLKSDTGFSVGTVMDNPMPAGEVGLLQEYVLSNAKLLFGSKIFSDFLQDTSQHFDAVIADLYETEIYAGLAALYDCPMIWAYSMGAHWQVLRLIDGPTNPSYTADYLSSNVPPFTIYQRLEELWFQIRWTWFKWSGTLSKEKKAYDEIFRPLLENRGRVLPDYDELIYNASLVFANDHYTFGNVPAVPENFKFVGGYHVGGRLTPLPKDLQEAMDNAKHGVIYFSLGSMWKSKDLPKAVIDGLLKVFGELKETVIWKFEEPLINMPPNVKTIQWAPQETILAHPNCKFFITHGGLLSSIEAVHFGVPIIGIPIYFDQFINVNKAVKKGYALKVNLDYDLANNLQVAIKEMSENKIYKLKVLELFNIYKHRPMSPDKEVVHWIEQVINTKGALHLRSPSVDVPYYKRFYLDFIGFTLIVLLLILALCYGAFYNVKAMWRQKYKEKNSNKKIN